MQGQTAVPSPIGVKEATIHQSDMCVQAQEVLQITPSEAAPSPAGAEGCPGVDWDFDLWYGTRGFSPSDAPAEIACDWVGLLHTARQIAAAPPCQTSEIASDTEVIHRLSIEVDSLLVAQCAARVTTLVSQSSDTKRGKSGLRRGGLFEVDGLRRNDLYLFPEASTGPLSPLFKPFLSSATFDSPTPLIRASSLCSTTDDSLCQLAASVSDHFGLEGMVPVLLQVIHEDAGHELSPHHDRPDWSAVVSVTLTGSTTFVMDGDRQVHSEGGTAWCLCDTGRHSFPYNTQHGHSALSSPRTAVVIRFRNRPH